MTRSGYGQRGFSLIEVLIAVLVLSIGMLGLGAVFPAIISVQRDAFETIDGENAASAAAAMLSNREMVNFSLISEDFNRPITSGFGGGAVSADAAPRYAYEWVVPQDGVSYYGWSSPVPGTDFETGLWSYNANNSSVNDTISIVRSYPELGRIPLSARLYPQPYSGREPRYVWDLALRREPSGDRLQAAIFVRRIDARIRVPRNESLSDVLTGNSVNGGRLPVAIDASTGRPAVDDGGNSKVYASIQMLEVEVYEEHPDWLVILRNQPIGAEFADTSVNQATMIGQKLVDNTGVVRTVVGRPQQIEGDPVYQRASNRGTIVVVDPPFSPHNAGGDQTNSARSNSAMITRPEWDAQRASWVRQVIFTPRIPVAVRVVTLEENS